MERDIEPRAADALVRQGALAVDVREPAELVEDGRIEGALHVPLGDLAQRAEELPRDRTLVMICRSGTRSAMATEALRASGYDAYNVDGGILRWERDGLPVARNP
ncbi:MAG TPA: rhodanese-like domain-containing protein [Solirubrobacteraceae bacterium]|nr:rhodanese-like domain-containing protein [Solirubrobacteraceae bacterium]